MIMFFDNREYAAFSLAEEHEIVKIEHVLDWIANFTFHQLCDWGKLGNSLSFMIFFPVVKCLLKYIMFSFVVRNKSNERHLDLFRKSKRNSVIFNSLSFFFLHIGRRGIFIIPSGSSVEFLELYFITFIG